MVGFRASTVAACTVPSLLLPVLTTGEFQAYVPPVAFGQEMRPTNSSPENQGPPIPSQFAHVRPSGSQFPRGPEEQSQKCNEMSCPVDCELTDWTGWSSCHPYCTLAETITRPLLGFEGRPTVLGGPYFQQRGVSHN